MVQNTDTIYASQTVKQKRKRKLTGKSWESEVEQARGMRKTRDKPMAVKKSHRLSDWKLT